ncbi:hypothetical protein GYMLUDRAFT_286363 [Collybiopsis luxurians FD-317 M1]|nr:hypothetical protein GYMLUDRAFT_286363 [Collybiopsis luxurians FD-317 M1]
MRLLLPTLALRYLWFAELATCSRNIEHPNLWAFWTALAPTPALIMTLFSLLVMFAVPTTWWALDIADFRRGLASAPMEPLLRDSRVAVGTSLDTTWKNN